MVFVDASEDPASAAYVVASGVLVFMVRLLERELGQQGWPFDASAVLAEDPEMSRCVQEFDPPWVDRSGEVAVESGALAGRSDGVLRSAGLVVWLRRGRAAAGLH